MGPFVIRNLSFGSKLHPSKEKFSITLSSGRVFVGGAVDDKVVSVQGNRLSKH